MPRGSCVVHLLHMSRFFYDAPLRASAGRPESRAPSSPGRPRRRAGPRREARRQPRRVPGGQRQRLLERRQRGRGICCIDGSALGITTTIIVVVAVDVRAEDGRWWWWCWWW